MLLLRDMLDRVILLALSGSFVWRMGYDAVVNQHYYNMLVVAGEIMVISFVLIGRRARDISPRWQDWLFGLAGTAAPLLTAPALAPIPFIHPALLVGVLAFALVMQIGAKASLFRSFGVVAANRGVATRGLYRFIRHSIYASYLLAHLAFLALNPNWWNAAVLAVCWCFQIARIGAEERVLTVDPTYAAYRARVRWRLVPGLY